VRQRGRRGAHRGRFLRRPDTRAASDRRIAPRLLGGLLVAVLVWATWFFSTGHAVRIDVDPADSAVRMRGGLVLPVGGNHFARPGDYTVEIQRQGYELCAHRSA